MVRLMRWMIGLMLTAVSSSFRAQFTTDHSLKTKLSTEDEDVGPQEGENQLYDFHSNDSTTLTTVTDFSSMIHLMELSEDKNDTCIPNSIHDFPPDFFNQQQRSKGGLIVHVLLAIYACYGLATICDTYFVPSLAIISNSLGLSSDVAGATFMAAGTSSPELFESIIGSFITEGDIGVGTIVGSAVFNILAVTSVCGLFAGKAVPLDWWPLTRDCLFYITSVVALIVIINDGRVYWYEATALLIMFVLYVLMMRFNRSLSSFFHSLPCCPTTSETPNQDHISETNNWSAAKSAEAELIKQTTVVVATDTIVSTKNGDCKTQCLNSGNKNLLDENRVKVAEDDDEVEDYFSPNKLPNGWLNMMSYYVTYPINMLFFLTVPNCSRPGWERFYPLTFFMSVVYIGLLSYFVAWMVTIMGYTVGIPDTVMGITFLAIGTSVPESYSSVIVCRKGMGNMAISNSVGSNVFDILFCLGLPWLIKATAFSATGYVQINSSGLVYSAMCLLATVVLLYLVIAVFHFQLNIKVGFTCLGLYVAFLTFASLVEMNMFGAVNPPSCITS